MHPKQSFVQVDRARDMFLDIGMALLPAIHDEEIRIIKMICKPFRGNPAYHAAS
jgi:hypothetical protein